MKKALATIGVVAILAAAGPANAALVSYNGGLSGSSYDPYPNPLAPPLHQDGSISLNQFNSALGTLNSVTIDLSSAFNYVTRFENTSPSSGSTVTKNLSQWLTMGTLGQTILDTGLKSYAKTWSVGTFDGIKDYAGTSGFTVSETSGITNCQLTLSGAALADYIGTGSLLFDVFSNASFSGGFTGGNGTLINGQSFVTTATVTYDYTPVPVPAAAWLLGSGLLGLLGIRRRTCG